MKNIIIFVVLVTFCVAFQAIGSQESHKKTMFSMFAEKFEKIYETEQEFLHRFSVFEKNLEHMITHQDDDEHGQYTVTKFSDLSPEEFEQKYLTLPSHKIDENQIPQQDEDGQYSIWDYLVGKKEEKIEMPKNFDWREKNVITEVKAQSTCGSCWAFTTAAMIESQIAIKYGKLENLSEQQLIDCDTINDGCGGGLMTDAYKFLQSTGGLQSRNDYGEYLNRKGQCHFEKSKIKGKIVNYYQIGKDEYEIQKELFLNGPVAVGINGRFLQFYDGGILNNDKCDERINHAVIIVGYGENEDGTKYWIIKNQWGKQWGNDGYFKLIRGQKKCGVHTYASIAFVE